MGGFRNNAAPGSVTNTKGGHMADKALRGHGLGSKSLADPSGVEMAARQEIAFV